MNVHEDQKSSGNELNATFSLPFLREHLVNLTKELIAFPSHIQEPLKIFELIEYIKAYFSNTPVNIKTYTYGGLPALVISIEDTKHPHILLSGHVDVVPSSRRYNAEIKDNLLYGSGAMDMKGGVACMMAVLKYFAMNPPPPSLAIMLTSDEEVDSSKGVIPLLAEENYRADFVIVNEGREKYDIVIREKGILDLKFTIRGDFAHSAYPWKTDNVLEKLLPILLEIKKIFPPVKEAWQTTGSITVLHGGKEANTIPGLAEAIMNIRFTDEPNWSKEKILKKISALLPKEIELQELQSGEVFSSDPDTPYIQLLQQVAKEVTGKKIAFGENHGASDAKNFSNYLIPTAILGPVGKYHHSPEEYVEINSLVTHFQVLKTFIEKENKTRSEAAAAVLENKL